MTVDRWWTETAAALGDHVPLPLATLLLLLVALVAALAWYHFPAWVPRRVPRFRLPRVRLRLPRLRRPRRRRRDASSTTAEPPVPAPRDGAPERPTAGIGSLADRLAAEGRYAESVRERLRGMIRDLVAGRLVEQRPGMTVTEVTAAAARNRPQVDPPLTAAGAIFSDLWYAQRPASVEHDRRMRELADELRRALVDRPGDGDRP